MKKIVNDPSNYVDDMLDGIYEARGDMVKYVNQDKHCYCIANKKPGKVAIVTGWMRRWRGISVAFRGRNL